MEVDAKKEELEQVMKFVSHKLKKVSCPERVKNQLLLAVEEIFVNIAAYAYKPESGRAAVRCRVRKKPPQIIISFTDQGRPYNPLSVEDPDTSLTAEERAVGGLGVFLVKKTMDAIAYEYRNGENILTIKKYIEKDEK